MFNHGEVSTGDLVLIRMSPLMSLHPLPQSRHGNFLTRRSIRRDTVILSCHTPIRLSFIEDVSR